MPPTILVVDDDPGVRHALVEALLDAGYAVEQASDGLMALRQIARQVPDLILSDVRMPRLDGIGLATTLAPHAPAIPIILMSANPLPYGCAHSFIRKPFSVETLLTLMARTLPPSSVATVALSNLGAVSG
jgi:CheY-like chemotaxis protein